MIKYGSIMFVFFYFPMKFDSKAQSRTEIKNKSLNLRNIKSTKRNWKQHKKALQYTFQQRFSGAPFIFYSSMLILPETLWMNVFIFIQVTTALHISITISTQKRTVLDFFSTLNVGIWKCPWFPKSHINFNAAFYSRRNNFLRIFSHNVTKFISACVNSH